MPRLEIGERRFKGPLSLLTEPTLPTHIPTKNYVDLSVGVTTTNITVDIDPTSTVPEPPADTKFSNQDDVDQYLSDNSGTAFKHIRDFTKCLPGIITHLVTLQLAAGIHRPRSGRVIEHQGVRIDPGELVFQGRPVAEYDTVHAGGTIRSHQTIDEVTGVPDPYVVCDPGTFPDDNSLAGRFAVFSNGFYSVIWKHDDQQLWLCKKLNPVPVDDSTTVAVKQPSSVVRNSINDTSRVSNSYPIQLDLGSVGRSEDYATELNDILFQDFDAGVSTSFSNSRYVFRRFILDKTYGPLAETGYGLRFWYGADVTLYDCSFIATPLGGVYGALEVVNNSWCLFRYSYLQGGDWGGAAVGLITDELWLWNTVIRGAGGYPGWQGALTSLGGHLNIGHVSKRGVVPTIAEVTGSNAGAILGAHSFFISQIRFMDVDGPCIVMADGARMVSAVAAWGVDFISVNCTDVGYEMFGPRSTMIMDSAAELSGTAGDVRMKDGSIWSYADLIAAGPTEDEWMSLFIHLG